MRKKPFFFLLFLLGVLPLFASTYYVAVNGDDMASGSLAHPWRSIQKAANTVFAGDTVYVMAGTYNERVIVQNSGTSGSPIVFSNYLDDEVIIDGNSITWGGTWNGLFDISDKNYIELKGFHIINADYAGIWVENASHINIINNYTHDTFSSGIGVWGSSYVEVNNNEVVLACHEGPQECISIANSTFCEISNNLVHDNGSGTLGGEGIDIKQGSHDIEVFDNIIHHINNRIGLYVDAWDVLTYNIHLYRNVVHHCGNGGITVQTEMGGELRDVSIYNNISYYNKYEGIAVGSVTADENVSSTPVKLVKIINNTCYHNGSTAFEDGWGFGILVDNPDAEDIIIKNNICSQNDSQIAIQNISSGGIVAYNLIDGYNATPSSLNGTNYVEDTPEFVDVSSFDFHLQATSPAIDSGTSVDAPTDDFDSNIRPNGAGIDMGAYEYYDTVGIPSESFENRVSVYPNPLSDRALICIERGIPQGYFISLYDVNGKLKKMFQSETVPIEISIDRDHFSTGIYYLRIQSKDGFTVTKKLIIK